MSVETARGGAAHEGDHWVAHAIRVSVGTVTTVAGVAGLLETGFALATASALPSSLETILPSAILSRSLLGSLSLGATVGGVLLLRGADVGTPICSGTWAAVAALAARPSIRFQYAASAEPRCEFPAAGDSALAIGVFLAAAALAILTHAFGRATRKVGAKLDSTVGEVLVAALLLVSGAVAALTFRIDTETVGVPAYEAAFLPLLIATIVLEAIGLGLLLGRTTARALAIAILLAVAAGAFFPDLLLDCLAVKTPIFWAPVCGIGALALLVPRLHEAGRGPRVADSAD